ncbi:MAG TPA: hypothetical protein VHP35_01020, partial [Terriglobia bacterium]|nr:hypothetical protein [Terriglobia bacterium]
QSVEVTGQTALLQTEGAEVRSEFTTTSLSNLPLPLGRNYESLYTTIPGFTPQLPRSASRLQAVIIGVCHGSRF